MKGSAPTRLVNPMEADSAMDSVVDQPRVVKITTAEISRSPHPPTETGTTITNNTSGTAVNIPNPSGKPSARAQHATLNRSASTNATDMNPWNTQSVPRRSAVRVSSTKDRKPGNGFHHTNAKMPHHSATIGTEPGGGAVA